MPFKVTPEYKSWDNMKQRCFNKNNYSYRWCGKEGVIVCNRWLGVDGFRNFLKDMGNKPSVKHSLDRINRNLKTYKKVNCRWATKHEQVVNRRITKLSWDKVRFIKSNKKLNQFQLAKKFGTHQSTISRVINNLRWISK